MSCLIMMNKVKKLFGLRGNVQGLVKMVLLTGLASSLAFFSGCSTNPATGEQQFTALMSPGQERQIGAQEHENVVQSYGILPADHSLSRYVSRTGQRVARDTERPDINYKFFVVDDEMVNAFALPGGYIYVSRGLLAQANSEAELAAVLAHEVGHITARHSAERYSQGVLSSLGAMAVGMVLDTPGAGRLAGLGSELYIKSYSRGQELEADDLGIRYLQQAGYSPYAMASFLQSLLQADQLQRQLSAGQNGSGFDFFSTHPRTQNRVTNSLEKAARYGPQEEARPDRAGYLAVIDGMTYGSSARHGFVKENRFYHPDLDFTFAVPPGFKVRNQPTQIVATNPQGNTAVIFDAAAKPANMDPMTYLQQVWLKGEPVTEAETITINGRNAATGSFPGQLNGRNVTIRLVAVSWGPERVYRFMMAIPRDASGALIEELRRTTYSLRPMTAQEKEQMKPLAIDIVTAGATDSVKTLAAQMAVDELKEAQFRVLNGLGYNETVIPGQPYKIVRPGR